MSSSRYSSACLALVVALGLVVGGAGAVSVGQTDVPTEGSVGTDLTATIALDQLFQNPSYEQWTLQGETELENVTWTVQVIDQAGNQRAQPAYDSQTFDHPVDINSGAAEIRLSLTGTVPEITNYTYDPAESFLLVELQQVRQGGTSETIQTYEAQHYTESSREARQAMADAEAAIEAAGGHADAERTLESAISAYENENFENAVRLANQAEETAERSQSSQRRLELVLIALGVIVVLGLVVAGVIYWRRTRTHSRL